MATLTGAARVALGPELPALFCNDESIAAELVRIRNAGESDPVWSMPLWAGYEDELSSKIADLNNVSSSGFSGAIFGALFLKRFVTEAKAWLHLDLYAWNGKERPGRPVGAGVAVRPSAVRLPQVPLRALMSAACLRPPGPDEHVTLAGRDLAFLVVINLIWGLNLVAGKIGVGEFPPMLFTAMRFGAGRRCSCCHSCACIVARCAPCSLAAFSPVRRPSRCCSPACTRSTMHRWWQSPARWACHSRHCCRCGCLGETIRWRRRLGIVLAFGGIMIIGFDPRAFAYWEGLMLVVVSRALSVRSG